METDLDTLAQLISERTPINPETARKRLTDGYQLTIDRDGWRWSK